MGKQNHTKKLTKGSLLEILPTTMIDAAKEVDKVSGDWADPWEGAEYQYGVHLANRIWKKYSCHVVCEYFAKKAVEEIRPKKETFRFANSARPDLMIINSSDDIVALVEVKRNVWYYNKDPKAGVRVDLKKMSDVIKDSGKEGIRMGFSVFLLVYWFPDEDGTTVAERKTFMEDRFNEEFLDRARSEFGAFEVEGKICKDFPKPIYWSKDDEDYQAIWTAAAICISAR